MKKIARYCIYYAIILVYLSDCLEMLIPMLSSIFKLLKYGSAGIALSVCCVQFIFFSKNREIKFLREIKRTVLMVGWFAAVSVLCAYRVGMYTNKTFEELFQLVLPFTFAFFAVNLLSFDEILSAMKLCLVISFLSYLISLKDSINSINEILNISLISSHSPFESSDYAEMASGLSAFFIYYHKRCPFYAALSVLFVFMTFKRVLMLQAMLLVLIVFLKLSDKEVPKLLINASILIATAGTLTLKYLLKHENAGLFQSIFKMTPGEFTVTRVYRLWYPLARFKSYGFGSTTDVLGQALELDLIKVAMEIGVIGLLLLLWNYFSLSNKKLYCYVIIGTMMLNLLLASGLTSTLGWTSRIIALAAIVYCKDNNIIFRIRLKNKYLIIKKKGVIILRKEYV